MPADKSFSEKQRGFDHLIDALIDARDAPEEEYTAIVQSVPTIARAYKEALLETATFETGRDTDLNEITAKTLSDNTAFFLSRLTSYRSRKKHA